MTLNCIYVPSEEKHEIKKKSFYDKLDRVYQKASKYGIKIVMGDINAKVEKDVRIRNVGKHSLCEESNNNGMRLTDFSISRNIVISSMRLPLKVLHKET
jgi:exonuclease III